MVKNCDCMVSENTGKTTHRTGFIDSDIYCLLQKLQIWKSWIKEESKSLKISLTSRGHFSALTTYSVHSWRARQRSTLQRGGQQFWWTIELINFVRDWPNFLLFYNFYLVKFKIWKSKDYIVTYKAFLSPILQIQIFNMHLYILIKLCWYKGVYISECF